jgi:hypothetical protein
MVLLLSHFPESLRRCAIAVRRVCFSVNPVVLFPRGDPRRRVAAAFRGGRFSSSRLHRPLENARATCAVPRANPAARIGNRFAVAGRISRNVISSSSEWKRTAAPAANTVVITKMANCIISIMACLPVVHSGHGTATTKLNTLKINDL